MYDVNWFTVKDALHSRKGAICTPLSRGSGLVVRLATASLGKNRSTGGMAVICCPSCTVQPCINPRPG